MGPCIHRLKRNALMKKGTKSATNSCYGNNKHVVFLKLQPELKKKKKYLYIYDHAQVIQTCTTLSCVDIYNMDGKQQDAKQRKRNQGSAV